MDADRLDDIIDDALAANLEEVGSTATAGAIQAAVLRDGELAYSRSAGRLRLDRESPSVDDETRFDIASLTKPLVVGTLLMRAVGTGAISWSDPVGDVLPDWHTSDTAGGVTWAELANHTSGLPDWRPLYRGLPPDPDLESVAQNREAIAARIRETELDASPGERECYSDLGYVVLGWALERLADRPLEALADSRIFEPLGLDHTRFVSTRRGDAPPDRAVATERIPDRGGIVTGRVHDRNAAALGGVAGHAGCFSTALDIARFADHLLEVDAGIEPDGPLVDRDILRHSWSDRADGGVGHRRLSWDTPSGSPSNSGRGFQACRTVGHLGFTGTSVWLERDRRLVAVLLTNRVHPSRTNDRIDPFRIRFHEAVLPPRWT